MWTVLCENDHEYEVDAQELNDILEGESCRECESEITGCSPDEISLMPMCMHEILADFDLAKYLISEDKCEECRNNFEGDEPWDAGYSIEYTFQNRCAEYDWTHRGSHKEKKLIRRSDYWEFVVHYTTREKLISILQDDEIKASSTGYFRLPAVCLTETPPSHADEIRKRFGEYGIVFKKSDLIKIGAAPVIHLSQTVLKAQNGNIPDFMKPFVSKISIPKVGIGDKTFDFLHEREWRTSCNVSLRNTKPFGLIIPGESTRRKFAGDDWQTLMAAAQEYGEISF